MKTAKCYIATTISPMMIGHKDFQLITYEIENLSKFNDLFKSSYVEPIGAVGHENTAAVLKPIINEYLPQIKDINLFNRVNIELGLFDTVLAIIPNFRANEAREFTLEEIQSAGFKAFYARIENKS